MKIEDVISRVEAHQLRDGDILIVTVDDLPPSVFEEVATSIRESITRIFGELGVDAKCVIKPKTIEFQFVRLPR